MALVAGGLAVSLPAVLLPTGTCRPINCVAQQNAGVSTCILLPACTSARNTAMKLSYFLVPWLYTLTQPFWDNPWTTLVSLSTEFERASPVDKRKLSNNCYHAIKRDASSVSPVLYIFRLSSFAHIVVYLQQIHSHIRNVNHLACTPSDCTYLSLPEPVSRTLQCWPPSFGAVCIAVGVGQRTADSGQLWFKTQLLFSSRQ